MTALARPDRSRFFGNFRCPECSGRVAYRSRPRGLFEKHVLPVMLLQAVRCERCYLRVYALSMIPVLERFRSSSKPLPSETAGDSWPNTSVA